jgi:molybdopterin-guanine dinucleotide biosynthesis protein A
VKPSEFRINGVILAGGKGSRMQFQEKPLLSLGKRRVIDWILGGATPQVSQMLINVNKATDRYAEFHLPTIADAYGNDAGPLAGIHAAMLWSKSENKRCTHIACFPGDVPWFDDDFVQRLLRLMTLEHTLTGWLQTELQYQPLFSLWDIRLEELLAKALAQNHYSPMAFLRSQPNSLLLLPRTQPWQYLNLNSPEDLGRARAYAATLDAALAEKGY